MDLYHAVEAVRHASVPVYSIGIEVEEGDRDRPAWGNPLWKRRPEPPAIEALKRLTDGTGGWTYPIAAAKRCKEVCVRIAKELRHQYFVGYYRPTGGGMAAGAPSASAARGLASP